MRSPSLPAPRPMPTAATTSPSVAGAGGQGSAAASAFRGFEFAPRLSAFASRREGRKSLIGG
jgi:hypothetical protein